MRLLVTGGTQRRKARLGDEWHAFEQALVLEVDTETHRVDAAFTYVTPPAARPPSEPSIVFKSGSITEGHVYLCTQTEILVLGLRDLQLVNYLSLPCFNDVHHVAWRADQSTFVIANTGLDMVVEVDEEGAVRNCWNTLGHDPWERFDPSVDYRKIPTTKPHDSHPNYVFTRGSELWATRFEQRDAVSLTGDGRIPLDIGGPHDGVRRNGSLYFTTTNGNVIDIDYDTLCMRTTTDLNQIVGGKAPLGWCRGIAFEGDKAWVGFSRLRPTRIQKNVDWARSNASWVKSRFRSARPHDDLPTRIACFDLGKGQQVDEIELEQHDLNAVFSLLPVPGDQTSATSGAGT